MPPRKSISVKLRQKVAQRAQHLCEYCKSPKAYSPSPFDTEHIFPVSLGGETRFENLAYACNGCNGHKYNRTHARDPIDGDLVSLFNPRSEKWQEHFVWDTKGVSVIGITPSGRATVEALKLNRVEIVNLRKLLQIVGEHPPF